MTQLSSIADAIADFRLGRLVVVVDEEARGSEGALVVAADAMTEAAMAFMLRHGHGEIHAPMSNERADALGLAPGSPTKRVPEPTSRAPSVAAVSGAGSGESVADRTRTVRALADPDTRADDFAGPGPIVLVRTRPGGVLQRAAATEAAVDLCRFAGRSPVGVLCEIADGDGPHGRGPNLVSFAKAHDLVVISIADLIRHRRQSEKLVERFASARIPTRYGDFSAVAYRSVIDDEEHVAFVLGDVATSGEVLVRVHSECLTGDLLGSIRCDCGSQLDAALEKIGRASRGVIVYLRGHEGRGIGIGHKLRAYSLQDEGHDTVDANLAQGLPVDSREYGVGAQILADLGVHQMRLMTNNPTKYFGLDGYGLEITGREPLRTAPNPENIRYLETKRSRMGHLLDGADIDPRPTGTDEEVS